MTVVDRSPSRTGRVFVRVWAVLTATTVLSWQLVPGHVTATHGDELVCAIVVLALIKCRLIIGWFMEVRAAPRWLRWVTDTWLIVLWASLLGIYLWS